MELNDYEKRHIEYLEKNASECSLFLKRNNEFPITNKEKIVLVGNGARNTIKGGTGSGDVLSRCFKSIEEAFIESKYTITSKKWMDDYDSFKESTKKDFIKDLKKNAKEDHYDAYIYSMGFFEEEKNYDIDIPYDGDCCIYVLSRNSGEGNDRRLIEGDVLLSKKEVNDILFLNKKFKKFILVLNVGGVIDLSPVMDVSNILLLSQLGVVTGSVLVGILEGRYNPSGKLTTTWAKPENYPFYEEFGFLNDTYYKEGVYVGYRYFNTVNKELYFPFGYGISYTDFKIDLVDVTINESLININCKVKNIGSYSGKEVLQVYVTKPYLKIDNPYVELVNYKKTKELKPEEFEIINIKIDFKDFKNYDEKRALYILQEGEYIIRIGNSSINLKPICKCILKNEIVLERLENKCKNNKIIDFIPKREKEDIKDIKELIVDFKVNEVVIDYKKDLYKDPFIEKLSNEKLAKICLGNYNSGLAAMVGNSCIHAVGGAGETTLNVIDINKSLTMADGPAGLRLKQIYGIDKKGIYDISVDPIMEKMVDFLPKIARPFVMPKKKRKGEIHYQYTTAIPIGTAIAQSFSDEFVLGCGKIIKEEMELFNVDLWLAPALNIHRNILCGRNFEYFSEDPYLSGRMASLMVLGVEDEKRGVTIKHFACNNQEFNRNNNNSIISERTLREIYLKGFEICIKNSKPKALMTSYNLINGIHTSESYELINDILRCEWNYNGLVMSDWIQSGRSFCKAAKYSAPYASKNILAGNDLTMPGSKKDYKEIMESLKNKTLTREDLIISASRIYRAIIKQK